MSADLDACALTPAEGEVIHDAVAMADNAILTLLNEVQSAQYGAITNQTDVIGSLLVINSALRTVVKTLEDARGREVPS